MVRRLATLVLLIATLGGTIGLGQQPGSDSVLETYNRLLQALPEDPAAAARLLNARYGRQGLPLSYWIVPSVEDSRLQDLPIHEGPCGKETTAQSPRIPPPDKRLEAERLIEFNARGRELRRWRVPVYGDFVGVRGNTALLGFRTGLVLEINVNGSYRVAPRQALPEPEEATCPVDHGFGTSVYVRCVRVDQRTFAYQQTCT